MNDEIQILVVDDDPLLLDLMIETLNTIGYPAEGVLSGEKALSYLEQNEIQLLITDIKMPEMDGIELVQRVKEKYPKLPVIFISGAFTPAVLHKIGQDPFLAKPFRINQIEDLIRSAMTATETEKLSKEKEHILVVDDDDGFRFMLIENLKLSGYNVTGASNANKAIDLLMKGGIHTVVTDIKMPGMDGISLARYIGQQWPEIPVILVTAYINLDNSPELQYPGASGYLMKPFKIDSITELLEDVKNKPKPSKKPI